MTPPEKRPRVLGLTASAVLGKAKSQWEVQAKMESLQSSMGCKIVTVKDTTELDSTVPKPDHVRQLSEASRDPLLSPPKTAAAILRQKPLCLCRDKSLVSPPACASVTSSSSML